MGRERVSHCMQEGGGIEKGKEGMGQETGNHPICPRAQAFAIVKEEGEEVSSVDCRGLQC